MTGRTFLVGFVSGARGDVRAVPPVISRRVDVTTSVRITGQGSSVKVLHNKAYAINKSDGN